MQLVPTSLVRISRYYMLTAVFYLLATLLIGIVRVTVGLPDARVHWTPAILAWVSFPIMGAYYQFFPTLQGRDLRLERLTMPQYALVNLGVVSMIASAWARSESFFTLGLTVYALGALLFAFVMLGNLDLARLNLTLRFYLSSLFYFVVALALLVLSQYGLGPDWATRSTILHLFAFGWAVLSIMGAQYSMVPMLQLKELSFPHVADAQFYLANFGVLGLVVGMATNNRLVIASFGAVLVVAIALFAVVIISSLKRGPSRLKKLDISVRFMVASLVYLIVTALLGTYMGVTGSYALTPIHLHLGLIGVITSAIVGAMYHIVPFVVWWEVYAPRLGTEEVPLLKQLFDERSAERQFYGLNAGLLLMLGGFAFDWKALLAIGGALLFAVAADFLRQMLLVVGHRRMLRPAPNGAH